MRSLNKVFLLGHVGQSPELLTTKTGQPYTRLSIATHRRWKDDDEKWQEHTDWHNVMVWGGQAKICSQGINKGALVFIEGQLSPYSHTKEDGNTETRQSIHAQRVSFFNNQSLSREQVAG